MNRKAIIILSTALSVVLSAALFGQSGSCDIYGKVVKSDQSSSRDVKKTTVGMNITKEVLQSLPTSRNPWTIMNLVPGMMLDREDVGSSESGQQSAFYGVGGSGDDTTWHIDGINISDPSCIGTAPTYLNTNVYQEIQVTTAAQDITSQTGGTQLNFITRKAGNRTGGDFHLYVENGAWEMNRHVPESIADKGWESPGIDRLYQYGANLGGPIVKDKLWFFGSYAVQDIHTRTMEQQEDAAWIESMYGKIDWRPGKTSVGFQYLHNNRKRWGLTLLTPGSQDAGTYWDQTAPFSLYRASLQQEIGSLILNAGAAYTDSRSTLDPHGADVNAQTGHLEGNDWYYSFVPSRYDSGSLYYHTTRTTAWDLSVDGSWFAGGLAGTDHEIRFGVDYYRAATTSQTLYPNQRILFIYDRNKPDLYKEIWWITDTFLDVGFKRLSLYLADTITLGRLTANIGLRWDRETGAHHAATLPGLTLNGEPILTKYMGEVNVPSRKLEAGFDVFSPRLSLSYDVNGNGRSVLKASFGRYGSQMGNNPAALSWFVGEREIDTYWHDDDRDLVPDPGEFEYDPWWWNFGPWYYVPPQPNQVDPDYDSPILTEFTLAFEKVVGKDFVIALNGFFKKRTNLTWDKGLLPLWDNELREWYTEIETADNWYLGGTYTFASGKTTDYWLRYARSTAIYRTNHGSSSYDSYKALQLVLSKKLSHGWMLLASFTLSDWKRHLDRSETYDRTNFDFFDRGAYAPESGGAGLPGVYVNSRWQAKIAALFQLPFGINFSGVFQARDGYIVPYYELLYRQGLGWTRLYEPDKKFGDDRLPGFWILNLGLEKTFRLSNSASVTLLVNGYNITNNAATLNVDTRLGTPATGEVLRILNPGVFLFGTKVSF